MPLDVVIMAAGQGTRMKSARPKVLHCIGGKPLLAHVLGMARGLQATRLVVITGHGAEAVEAAMAAPFADLPLAFVRQQPQLGTGHAVAQALPHLSDAGVSLILNGDVPLVRADTARALLEAAAGDRLALLTVDLADPSGYGRIVRDAHDATRVLAIREHKDASAAERAIHEGYTGMMAVPTTALRRWIGALRNDNAQGEYYLTDIVAMAVAEGVAVVAVKATSETEVLGVNDPLQLAALERRHQRAQADDLLRAGVRMADPARLDVRGTLRCGRDVEIDVGCVFEGEVTLGDGVRVGPYCVLRDVSIEARAQLQAYTHIDGEGAPVMIGADSRVGPFARLRPGARLGRDAHVGNFVEIKNATLADGAKANHLAYVGDADLGRAVNFGAGAITANYDGANKHRTQIGADAHVGSNCVLVAPVVIGGGATIGAGSVIARDAPANALTLTRAPQVTVSGWERPRKGQSPR